MGGIFIRFLGVTSLKIKCKRNIKFEQGSFIKGDEITSRTLGAAKYVRGDGKARGKQAVRNTNKYLRTIIRFCI